MERLVRNDSLTCVTVSLDDACVSDGIDLRNVLHFRKLSIHQVENIYYDL